MTFIDSLAEQVPEWPRDTLASDFAAAVRTQIGSTLSAAPGTPRKDVAPLPAVIKPKKRKHRGFPPEVRAMLNARSA